MRWWKWFRRRNGCRATNKFNAAAFTAIIDRLQLGQSAEFCCIRSE